MWKCEVSCNVKYPSLLDTLARLMIFLGLKNPKNRMLLFHFTDWDLGVVFTSKVHAGLIRNLEFVLGASN